MATNPTGTTGYNWLPTRLELKYEGTRDIDPIEEILWEREQEGWLNAAHESIQRYHVAFEKDERYRLHALQVNRENYNVVMAMYGSKTDWGTLFSSALAASLEDFTPGYGTDPTDYRTVPMHPPEPE